MPRRLLRQLGVALSGMLAAMALLGSAHAGGWSLTVLDSGGALDPTANEAGITTGAPFTIGFTVLQHGKTPVDGLTPRITATSATGETVSFNGQADGKPGHYVATLTLPTAGSWNWQIDAFGPPTVMAPIVVTSPALPSTTAPATTPVALPLAALAVALALVAALLARRVRRPVAA